MRRQPASWIALWVATVVLPLSWGGLAAQAQQIVWIKFDDLPNGWRVDDDYAKHGVHFVNDFGTSGLYCASPQIVKTGSAKSAPNVLENDTYGGEFASSINKPLIIRFDKPIAGVGMQLGCITDCAYVGKATVSLLDCNGTLRAQKQATPSPQFMTGLQVLDPTETTTTVVVDYGSASTPEAIDDLAFQIGTGTCTDNQKPVVKITSHTDNQLVAGSPIMLSGTVTDNSGAIAKFQINGAPVKLTPHSGTGGKPQYSFDHTMHLVAGSNPIAAVAKDPAGNTDSNSITLHYGPPATVGVAEFHITQRGIMRQVACDVDDPFVAGKSTIVRIRINARTATGAPTFVSNVDMKLYRKVSGSDSLVGTFFGEQYSSQVSSFDSPAQMAGIHFWIPGESVDTPGEYTMRFKVWIGATQWPSLLEVPCANRYFTFSETNSINLLIKPVEAQLFSSNLRPQDYNDVFTQLDMIARMYPVRDGFRPWYQSKKAGVRYEHFLPYKLCDGSQKMKDDCEFCEGTGFEWTFKDVDPSGIWKADHQAVADASVTDCGNRTPQWGRITANLLNLPRPTIFGLFRGGSPGEWGAAKSAIPFDDNHIGGINDDLANYIAEFRNVRPNGTFEWTTDLSLYNHGEVYRTFVDSDGNRCWDRKTETAAPTARRWLNIQTQLWGPQKKLFDWFKSYVTWDPYKGKTAHPILWFPASFHPERKDFGMFDPGTAKGGLIWIRPGNHNVLPHELGHIFGFGHTPQNESSIPAWAAYEHDQQVDASALVSNMWFAAGEPNTRFFTDNNYLNVFNQLKVSSSAAALGAAESWTGLAFVVSGVIDPLGDLAFVDTSTTTAEFTEPDTQSPYRLLLGTEEVVLSETPFPVDRGGDPPFSTDRCVPDPCEIEDPTGTFRVAVPLPDDMTWAEIVDGERVLLHFDRSQNAPTVRLTQPNGGEHFGSNQELLVEWVGDDPDGDALEYSVSYSPDGGTRWYLMAGGLTTTSMVCNTADVPGGQEALIQVQASDGFHLGQDQSDMVFSIEGKPPIAMIYEPRAGSEFLEHQHITLRGGAIDGETEQLTITWRLNGSVVAADTAVRLDPLAPGAYTATMQVLDGDGLSDSVQTHFNVLADSDADGMSDQYEETYGLEPSLAQDALGDVDWDGLNNFDESWRGLDPTNPDTDGDGLLDGEDPDPADASLDLQGVDVGGSLPPGQFRKCSDDYCQEDIGVTAGGNDIWDNTDQFYYVYRSIPVSGDFTAVVGVKSMDPYATAHEWAKAGIMARQNLEPGSPHAMVIRSLKSGVALQGREIPNGGSWNNPLGGDYGPDDVVWLRLDRQGNVFTGSYLIGDEMPPTRWTANSSHEVVIPPDILLGLATTSHQQERGITVEYIQFCIGPYAGPVVIAQPPVPPGPNGGNGFMGIREIIDNGEINDQDACYASLNSAEGTIVDYAAPVLNIQDSGGNGNFAGDDIFGVVTERHRGYGDVDHLSLVARGMIRIPPGQGGIYTFGV
ncbi:MAG: hypothetical protein JSU70_00145, partial [Phycisphaerales bacterium]